MSEEIRPVPRVGGFNIQAAVDRELGKTDPKSKVALILSAQKAPGENAKGKLAVMVKQPGGGWSFSGYLEGEQNVGLTVGAQLKFER